MRWFLLDKVQTYHIFMNFTCKLNVVRHHLSSLCLLSQRMLHNLRLWRHRSHSVYQEHGDCVQDTFILNILQYR